MGTKKGELLGVDSEAGWGINKAAFFGGVVSIRGTFWVSKDGRFRFELTLPMKDFALMREFQASIGGGGSLTVVRMEKKPFARLVVQSYRDILQGLIPFLRGNLMFEKRLRFEEWCKKLFERLEERYQVDTKKLATVLGFVPGFTPTAKTPFPLATKPSLSGPSLPPPGLNSPPPSPDLPPLSPYPPPPAPREDSLWE